MDVVDNPEFSQEHQALALGLLSLDIDPKKLTQEEVKLYDEIAHQLAGTTPSGHKHPPIKSATQGPCVAIPTISTESEDYTDIKLKDFEEEY